MAKSIRPAPAIFDMRDPEQWPRRMPGWADVDIDAHPVIAAINHLAAAAAEIIGPLLWAALIVLFLWAEISSG